MTKRRNRLFVQSVASALQFLRGAKLVQAKASLIPVVGVRAVAAISSLAVDAMALAVICELLVVFAVTALENLTQDNAMPAGVGQSDPAQIARLACLCVQNVSTQSGSSGCESGSGCGCGSSGSSGAFPMEDPQLQE